MIMKRFTLILISLSILLALPVNISAQLSEVYTKEHIANKAPVPYSYIREADVLWAKDIYRMIDLRQLQNLPLYYPTNPIGDRFNLAQLILWGVDNEGVIVYSTDDVKNEFTIPIDRAKIDEVLGAGSETIRMVDVETGLPTDTVIQTDRRIDEIQQILVKEKWYFDRNHSVMNVRIVGLCPIRIYYRYDEDGMPMDEPQRRQTFWVYFPSIRPLLARHEVYNNNNDAQRISFDDFFMQRRFSSYIFAESNVYENRWINQYATGLDALIEAEEIKDWLFNVEHDMWEY